MKQPLLKASYAGYIHIKKGGFKSRLSKFILFEHYIFANP